MHRPIQLAKINSSRRTSPITWPNDNKAIRTRFPAVIAGLFPVVSILMRRIAFPLLLLGAALVLVQPCAGQSETWSETGSLITARDQHTATLLPNGKVLAAGGEGDASTELYDPGSGTWTATGRLATRRYDHTATLLPNGKVLVAAGFNLSCGGLASAELYDPASGTWTATGSLAAARLDHTATLLPNDKVLVAGGTKGDRYLADAELYDSASGTWTGTGRLATARGFHTATLLPSGEVLAAGGYNLVSGALSSAELYMSNGGGGIPSSD